MPNQALFPTQIYRGKVQSSSSRLHRNILSEAMTIKTKDRQGQAWSAENYFRGFTSYGSLDQLHRFSSTFEELGKKISPHVKSYFQRVAFVVPFREIRLTRMWVNVMGNGCTHAFHIHPLSVISGSYYVQMPPKCSALKFEDPRAGLFMARPPTAERSAQQKPYVLLKPKPGEVVLFESWLRHEVPPNGSELERVSVSFNYDWVGK